MPPLFLRAVLEIRPLLRLRASPIAMSVLHRRQGQQPCLSTGLVGQTAALAATEQCLSWNVAWYLAPKVHVGMQHV
jgi:hypothetical protein